MGETEVLKPGTTPGVPPLFIGRLIGNYRITHKIGEGGMGAVYRATHTKIPLDVAIKVIDTRRQVSINTLVERFKREATMLTKLNHPNCVHIHTYDSTTSLFYLVIDLIEGMDLLEFIERHCEKKLPIPTLTIIKFLKEICLALDAAHTVGMIHRDLKPENIRLQNLPRDPYFVRVLDFGIAKLVENDDKDSFKTEIGTICGTPEYMAPEVAMGQPLDGRSDLYSLGTILYQMLTFKLPFTGENHVVIATKKIKDPFPTILPHEAVFADSRLIQLTYALCEKNPDHRPRTAYQVYQILEVIENEIRAKQVRTEHESEVQTLLERISAPPPPSFTRLSALNSEIVDVVELPPVTPPVHTLSSEFDFPNETEEIIPEKPRWIYAVMGLLSIAIISLMGILYHQNTLEPLHIPQFIEGGSPQMASIEPVTIDPQTVETESVRERETLDIPEIPIIPYDIDDQMIRRERAAFTLEYILKPVITGPSDSQKLARAVKLVLTDATNKQGCAILRSLLNSPLRAKAQSNIAVYCN